MDKNAIKKYAVWARTELITRVSQRAEKYDITAEADVNATSVNGMLLSDAEKKQRKALIEQVKQKGLEQVMEEVAYTWFNRFIALRFMEVNGYLPSHIRVFTDDNNEFKPQILAEAIHLELDGLDMEKVYEMKNNNENDELYKYLIIVQCNELSKILPGMFQKISDYTELLFPDNILREGSVIEQLVKMIPQDNWNVHTVGDNGQEQGQIQIIGWLYQYYNTEPKNNVFSDLKNKKKITKEKIPAATQLFTPRWIVDYMVENSLGRLWANHNDELSKHWNYYLEEAGENIVTSKDKETDQKKSNYNPGLIKCLDPSCGSGHILAYMFDVLVQIYDDYGIGRSEAVDSIISNNIYGLDIDDRAAQLAYFSVMMKAVQYDRRFFRRKRGEDVTIPQPHIFSIVESNDIDKNVLQYFINNDSQIENSINSLAEQFRDAKEYGSLINIKNVDFEVLKKRCQEVHNDISIYKEFVENKINSLIDVAMVLAQHYQVVITNPPYMSNSGMNKALSDFVKKHYNECKSDLYACFIKKCKELTEVDGYLAMITMHSWMFLPRMEELRDEMLKYNLINMIHLGTRAFEEISGEVVQTVAFVYKKCNPKEYVSTFMRAVDYPSQDEKEQAFLNKENLYYVDQHNFYNMPGHTYSYWASANTFNAFTNCKTVADYGDARQGMATGNNEQFVRYWYEPLFSDIGFGCQNYDEFKNTGKKYVPYIKSAGICRWYGNYYTVLKFDEHNYELLSKSGNCLPSKQYYFRENANWSLISTDKFGARYAFPGGVFDVGAHAFYGNNNVLKMLGYLNSSVFEHFIKFLSPTINYNSGIVAKVPAMDIPDRVQELVSENIEIAKKNWDKQEISWDFKKSPIIGKGGLIEDAIKQEITEYRHDLEVIKNNEDEINNIFIELFGLTEDFKSDDEKNDNKELPTEKDLVIDLLSYAIGCIFGRYSLDKPGLVYTGGVWNQSAYQTFEPNEDGIIPICDDEYFADDVVVKVVKFIETVYGRESLEENLAFISKVIGGKGLPRDVIRNYFITDFYKNHVKQYQKCPIYWMFDSGKKNGFKCLIYIHRYKTDTIARIRTDYVHELQSRYRTAFEEINTRTINSTGSEKIRLVKQKDKIQSQSDEIHQYEEKIHHIADQMIPINMDDGIKKNYELFNDVLSQIK